jgi:DNA-directed RNA polymerase specialized sigma24 family protein
VILRAHRFRLRREDLEDCFGQAVLELTVQVRRGERFASRDHLGHVLEQRVLSRIHDRRRALAGRSPIQAALEGAWSLGEAGETEIQIVDRRSEVEELVILRQQLRRIEVLARRLTPDQRLVLASQVAGAERADFCEIHGWSGEKYRKVAQRARARLRHLMGEEELGVPPASEASDGEPGTNL